MTHLSIRIALVVALAAAAGTQVLAQDPAPQPPAPAPPSPQEPPPPARPDQRPTFRTGVDLVPVDVNVIDREGNPVHDLTADDFVLTVDGRPRRIASAEFIRLGGDTAPPPDRPSHYSTNAAAAGGRLVTLVIDQGNISVGRGRYAIDAAVRFVQSLSPSDRVALYAIPGAGPQINFTANHALVLTMLRNIVGQMSPDLGRQRVGMAEAARLDRGDLFTQDAIVDRECINTTGPERQMCEQDIVSEARTVYSEMRDRTRNSLTSLRFIMQRLAENPSPKTVVFISEGLAIDRDMSELIWVGPLAERGRASLYVLHLMPPPSDAAVARPSPTRSEDISMAEEGLSVMAGLARGTVFRVVSSAEYAFSRLSREISGYYLLSFEPEGGDRDGEAHKIKIQVPGRRNIEIRARQEFRVDNAGVRTDEDAITETIKSPLLATDINLKVSTYTLLDAKAPHPRVIVAAEIDRSRNRSHKLALGYVIVDDQGRLVADFYEPQLKIPVRDDAQQFLGAVTIQKPGVYILKLAVVDDEGRRGSVEHPVRAQLASAGQIRVTDLIIGENTGAPTGAAPAVTADFVADEVSGYLELYSDAPAALERASVMLEVADTADASAIESVEARFTDTNGSPARRVAEGRIPIALLPPGEYVARAIVNIGGRKAGQVTRPFRINRAAARLAAPGEGATIVRRGTPTIPFVSRIERFERAEVLTPQVVGFFLDRLNVGNRGLPPAAALDHARAGRFDEALDAARAENNQALSTVFLNGLSLYAKGDLEDAAVKFRETLRLDTEFFPAAFYLGACYAAGGRDRDAAAAWQTSLVTEGDAPFIYTLLGDALLRQRAAEQAVDILTEAATLWPDSEEVQLRLGTALAQAGRAADALKILDPYLVRHPEDHERHFVALRAIYEAHAAGGPVTTPEEDRQRFDRYAAAYAAAKGPQQELVERWRKFMSK
jgi:VWFA-related protein